MKYYFSFNFFSSASKARLNAREARPTVFLVACSSTLFCSITETDDRDFSRRPVAATRLSIIVVIRSSSTNPRAIMFCKIRIDKPKVSVRVKIMFPLDPDEAISL